MNTIDAMVGVTMRSVEASEGADVMVFTAEDGRRFVFDHDQDCCESVDIHDIAGDVRDLVGAPILVAEETSSDTNPDDVTPPEYQDSFTWTFYRFQTIKGSVTVRWYGASNGYYSERVSFTEEPSA